MLFEDWYTDTVDVYRVVRVKTDNVTRAERQKVNASPIPCRVYESQKKGASPQPTAALDRKEDKLACSIDADIKADDELIVTRGGLLGHSTTERYIAGKPQLYYDPVGIADTGLEHMEVGLLADNIVRN